MKCSRIGTSRMLHLCDVEIKAGGPPQPPLVAAAPCVSGSHEQVSLLASQHVPVIQHTTRKRRVGNRLLHKMYRCQSMLLLCWESPCSRQQLCSNVRHIKRCLFSL